MQQVDARNMPCPRPVVLALSAFQAAAAGDVVEVLVNDSVARENLERLAADRGAEVQVESRGDYEAVIITLSGDAAAPAVPAAATPAPAATTSASVVMVGSATMGTGNDELGGVLMKGLIYALSQQEQLPQTMVFFNGGASLTCEGSESLDDIRALEEAGCEVLTCGTCLDYLHIREKLAVGGVTNLYRIAELMTQAPGVTLL